MALQFLNRFLLSGLQAIWPPTLWTRLLLLLLAAAGPLLGLLLVGAVEDGRVVLDGGREQAIQLARLGAEQHDDILQEAASLLGVLARVDAIRDPEGSPCNNLLRAVILDHPRLEALALAGPDGTVSCSSRPTSIGLSIANRDYFTEAMRMKAGGRYVLSGLTLSRVSGRPTMFATVPVPSATPGEEYAGVLVASIGLEPFARLRDHVAGSAQLFQVIDGRDGALLAQFPNPAGHVGRRHPDHPLMQAFRASPGGGSIRAPDLDGVRRIFGFAPFPGSESGLFLVVGLSEAEVGARAEHRFWLAIGIALGTTGFAVLVAWLAAQRALLQPIQALAAAANAVGAGNLFARATIGRGAARELRNLGATFTRMARRLRDRDAKLAAMQVRLAASEEHHRLLADTANDMITRFDRTFRRTYVSHASEELLGYAPQELIGQEPRRIVHPDDWEQLNATLNLPLQAGQSIARASYRACRKDGQFVWLESSGRRLLDGSGFVVVTRDVSERKVLEARLEDANRQLRILVRQDGLTGLANRRRFDEALGDEYRRAMRGGHPLALIMLDVDRFKAFNDLYGHPAGDSCLRALSGVFATALRRSGDLAARYGGEEFAILMADTDLTGALTTAERLRTTVRGLELAHAMSDIGVVTISVGVAILQPLAHHPGPAALVEAADAALYAAKTGGRNRICVAPDEVPHQADRPVVSRPD